MQIDSQKINEYFLNFDWPAEKSFFTQKQKERVENYRQKYEATRQFLSSVKDNLDLWERLDKLVMSGQLYSSGEYARISLIIRALERHGIRYNLPRSLVSTGGECLIMSENCAQKLGFMVDGYILEDELADLTDVLRQEGLDESDLNKLKSVISTQGIILLQRGGFIDLKELLQDALGEKGEKAFASLDQPMIDKQASYSNIIKSAVFQQFKTALQKNPKYQPLDDEVLAELVFADTKVGNLIPPGTERDLSLEVAKSYSDFMEKIDNISDILEKDEKIKRLRLAVLSRINQQT